MTRAQRLMDELNLKANQAILISSPSNMFYLSNYTGEGYVWISRSGCNIITDFRYIEQAGQEAPSFSVCMTEKGLSHEAIAAGLAKQSGVSEVYYEEDTVTVSDFHKLQKALGCAFLALDNAVTNLREIKDEGEIALIEKACAITGEAFERLLPQIKEGMTEREIALILEFDMFSHGAQKLAFSTIVAAGANGSLPHAKPGDYKIRRGDMITMDFGAKVGGYCADMTRTVAFGKPSDEMKRVYDVVLTAQLRSQDALAAGKRCQAIDAIARDYIDQQGYKGRFGHGLGHAVGIDIHEEPRLNAVSTATCRANQVLTVEPGIYLPGIGGVRIENSCLVLDGGCRSLTLPTRELIIL